MHTNLSFYAIVSLLLGTMLFAGCSKDKPSSYIEGPAVFHHQIVDANPNAGTDCCLDVCAIGDINGDGFVDIVVGSENAADSGLVWYEYPLWTKHEVASGQFTTDGKVADIDDDGDNDIIITDYGQGVFWYENRLNETDMTWTKHPISDGYGHDLEVGDIDGDGRLEVVIADKKGVILCLKQTSDTWVEIRLSDIDGEGIALYDLNADDNLDIIYGPSWLEAPENPATENWERHIIDANWPTVTRARVGDINNDGRVDIVLTAAEGAGQVVWYESPLDVQSGVWQKHVIESDELTGAHSLQLADFDNDGRLDVLTAEMHTSSSKRILVYFNKAGGWEKLPLGNHGSHNMQVADIGNDGDIDIIGKNYAGADKKVELWENQQADLAAVPKFQDTAQSKNWRYHAIDSLRDSSQSGKFGLVFADLNSDGYFDIIAGSIIYLNPDGVISDFWPQVKLPDSLDIYFASDTDGDSLTDLIGCTRTQVIHAKVASKNAMEWYTEIIAEIPAGRTQGYISADINNDTRSEFIFTHGQYLYALSTPDIQNGRNDWNLMTITSDCEEEGVAAGDIDGDGDIDLAVVSADGHHALWLENRAEEWVKHIIGPSEEWLDRVALVDINGDGRLGLVASEETRDLHYNARLYWFEAPQSPAQIWHRHTIATLRSINSLDIADLNGDGLMDLVVAEHTDFKSDAAAADNVTAIFLNNEKGENWTPVVVDKSGRSSHLGARPCDLDNDGDLDIVSIAWKQYRYIHLWENLAAEKLLSADNPVE